MDEGAKRPEVRAIQTKRLYMWRVDGAKVTRLTLGELRPCLEQAPLRNGVSGVQQSAKAKVVEAAPSTKGRTPETTGANRSTVGGGAECDLR